MTQLVIFADRAPALIAAVGERASYRFLEFFTANIRNPNTRRAYARVAVEFFDWLATLVAQRCVHVAPKSAVAKARPRDRELRSRRAQSSIGWSSARSCR